jgi:osmotically-inducible protein OsmY
VDNRRVTLTGTVASLAEKRRASADAWVYGVDEVVADLTIDPSLRDRQREVERPAVPDAEIADAIELAAAYDPRVVSFEITPTVIGGIAILTGRVDNLKAKLAAEEVARNTVGILAVNNHIQVEPSPHGTDQDARDRLVMALAIDPITDAYEIDVKVDDGLATLTGTVDNYAELAEATDVALGVRGIAWVENELMVRRDDAFVHSPYVFPFHPYVPWGWYVSQSPTQDAKIESDIETELFWSPFVDADEVHVDVHDGVATLTGEVDSWRERSSATENAYEGGALSVDNELEVG